MEQIKLNENVLLLIKPNVVFKDVVVEAAYYTLLPDVMSVFTEVDTVSERLLDFNIGSVFQHSFTSYSSRVYDAMGYFYDAGDLIMPLLNREVGSIKELLTLVEKSEQGFAAYVIKHGDFYFAVLSNYVFFYEEQFVNVQLTAVLIDSTLNVKSIDDI